MFKDYFAILEISEYATDEEIKSAFKKQALKWHPDRNPGIDTTVIMQEINEAKLILLDREAREKYYAEYVKYKEFNKKRQYQTEENEEDVKYDIKDALLYKWMINAQRQAVELAKQTKKDFKGMASAGLEAGLTASGNAIINQLIIGGIILIIFAVVKSCK